MKANYALCTGTDFNSINTPGADNLTGHTNQAITYDDYNTYITRYGGFSSLTIGSLVATGKTRTAATASTLCVRYDDLVSCQRKISAKLASSLSTYLIGKSVSGVTNFGTITAVAPTASTNAPLKVGISGTTGTYTEYTLNVSTSNFSLLPYQGAKIVPGKLGGGIEVTGSTGVTGKLLEVPYTATMTNTIDTANGLVTYYLTITPTGTPVIDPSSTGTSASISVTYIGGSWQVKNNSSRTIYYKAKFSPAASPQSFSWVPSSASTTPATSVAAGATSTFGAAPQAQLAYLHVFWSTSQWSGSTGYMYEESVVG